MNKINIIKNWIKNNAFVSSVVIVLSLTSLIAVAYVNKINRAEVSTKKFLVENPKNEQTVNSDVGEISQKNLNYKEAEAANAASNRCGINPSPECAALIFGDPNIEFSELFLGTMAVAGETLQTPSAIILSYMTGIGTVRNYSYMFSTEGEKKLEKNLHWAGRIEGCDDLEYMEQGPGDWELLWWDKTIKANPEIMNFFAALNVEFSNAALSRCNMIHYLVVTTAHFNQIDGNGCDATYSELKNDLKSLSWGSVIEGAYAEDQRYEEGDLAHQVFEACVGR